MFAHDLQLRMTKLLRRSNRKLLHLRWLVLISEEAIIYCSNAHHIAWLLIHLHLQRQLLNAVLSDQAMIIFLYKAALCERTRENLKTWKSFEQYATLGSIYRSTQFANSPKTNG